MFKLDCGSVSIVVLSTTLAVDVTELVLATIGLMILVGSLYLHCTCSSGMFNPSLLCSNLAVDGSLLSPQTW